MFVNKKTASSFGEETVLWVSGYDTPVRCFVRSVVIVEKEDGVRAFLNVVNTFGTELMFPLSDIIDANEDTLPQAA